jgi:hypothetical protein
VRLQLVEGQRPVGNDICDEFLIVVSRFPHHDGTVVNRGMLKQSSFHLYWIDIASAYRDLPRSGLAQATIHKSLGGF